MNGLEETNVLEERRVPLRELSEGWSRTSREFSFAIEARVLVKDTSSWSGSAATQRN